MSDLKAKMHQIRFPLGLRPRPRWGSLQLSDPLAAFKGPTVKGREWEKGRRREGERKGNGRVGQGREGRKWEGKGGKRDEWKHAPIRLFESRRLWLMENINGNRLV